MVVNPKEFRPWSRESDTTGSIGLVTDFILFMSHLQIPYLVVCDCFPK